MIQNCHLNPYRCNESDLIGFVFNQKAQIWLKEFKNILWYNLIKKVNIYHFFDNIKLFWSFNWIFNLFINIEVIFFNRLIKNRSNLVQFNQKKIEIVVDDTILTLKSELSLNRHPNSDGLKSESSMIGFQTPNCLSLQGAFCYTLDDSTKKIYFCFCQSIPKAGFENYTWDPYYWIAPSVWQKTDGNGEKKNAKTMFILWSTKQGLQRQIEIETKPRP